MEFNPTQLAINWLIENGYPAAELALMSEQEIMELLAQMLTKGGRFHSAIQRAMRLSSAKLVSELETNAAETIARVNAMKKIQAIREVNPDNYKRTRVYRETLVRNVSNTVRGTLSRGVALWCEEHIPDEDLKKIVIKWKPSHARVHDIPHARHYGQTMTLYRAFSYKWGIRYGCKCGAVVVKGGDILAKYLKRSPFGAMVV